MTLEQEYRERYNEGLEEGQLQGEIRGKIEILYYDMQMTISEIAQKLSMTEEQVREIVENLKETAEMS